MRGHKPVRWIVALSFVGITAITTVAQTDSSNQNVQELRKQLDDLREQMNKLQARLSDLESTKANVSPNPQAAPSVRAQGQQQGTIQTTQPLAQGAPSPQVGQATATFQQSSEDTVAAARFNNVPLDPKYRG